MLCALIALLVASPSAPATAPAATVTSDTVVGSEPRLHDLTVASPALGGDVGVRVLLPAGYDDAANASRRYPVLLLLHGVGDDHTTWADNTDIEGFTAALPLIVVMPDGGKNSDAGWYSDWVDGPAWESFHIGELLPLIDASYRTAGGRAGRVVAGLSMGGFGTMSYGARHPDLFVAAASFSGAVDTATGGPASAIVFELLHPATGTPDDRVWGPYETSEATWRGHNPVDLVTNLRPLALFARTGNGVPAADDPPNPGAAALETGIYTMNLSFDAALDNAAIPHEFVDRGHGMHTWRYWEDDLAITLPKLMAVLAAPPAPPSSFDYRFVEPQASVFGWTFAIDRPATEFLDLQTVSDGGLVAVGTGLLTVTTSASFGGGAWSVRAGDSPAQVLTAIDSRLTFTVDLGPGHVDDQYSPAAKVAELAAGDAYRRTVAVTITPVAGSASSGGALSGADARATTPATGGDGALVPAAAFLLLLALSARRLRLRQ